MSVWSPTKKTRNSESDGKNGGVGHDHRDGVDVYGAVRGMLTIEVTTGLLLIGVTESSAMTYKLKSPSI
jgi:hypothetical protein